ncbi:MAG: superoxide dismutase family protein [Candidatus Poribacteria bacterium]|nr:superoxide dismutase family protein [Candidatus Poribacteria bacterium]
MMRKSCIIKSQTFSRYCTHIALVILILTACFIVGCERIPTDVITVAPVNKVAVATISAIDGSSLTGTATFTETDSGVHVVIEIQNATPGLHATHLHIGSNCDDVGPHWHPMGVPAGTVGVPVAEATLDMLPIGIGEIGNIPVGEDGAGVLEFTTPFWSVGGDANTDILGKLILIHETGDTFQTNPHAHHTAMPNIDANAGAHTHNIGQMQMVQTTHVCTLAVLGQQIDLEADHHLPGQAVNPHSHDILELLLTCFVSAEQLADPRILTKIPLKGSPEHQAFLKIEPKSLAAYHEFFMSIELPVAPDFFTNQYKQLFPTGAPKAFEQEMRKRLTHLYITSGIDFENLTDMIGYNVLLTNFLDERTTAWVLGYFQGDDGAFGEWIVSVLKAVQVRPGGGSRIGCGVIGLME